ncbi:MAG: D-glycero-beta-D-manno-heptose-1,7-bisphosphate 7-phosphatase [Cycloclasticus sp. symbiont of Poecilosclerida sp. N]|nr:MAG: D-glycero-beta-D-manno-heptose-1,7-bisphosphate 7-phosphatase [Cycloclasticus sp. symbiont of Poecilosclerida sp. N]
MSGSEIKRSDIILDRDGVINLDSDAYVKSADEWLPINSSIQAIAQLHKAGHRVFIATNQSGVGRGYFTLDILNEIHQKMLSLIHEVGGEVVDIAFCPHSPDDGCACRKPKAGLLKILARDNRIDLANAIVIGDSLRDLQAADKVGATAFLVLTGKGKRTQRDNTTLAYPIFKNLYDASQAILA